MAQENEQLTKGSGGVNAGRLFLVSCLALVSTSVAFSVVTSNMDQFKEFFVLSNAQAGTIGGVTMWGFTISIMVLGPLVDITGIKMQIGLAFVCHLVGTLLMVFANGFNMLFAGGFLVALGNGTVEAACNPLVATLFPNNKTTKLNKFHVWFPGGIVIGGLIAYGLDNFVMTGENDTLFGLKPWQVKLAVVLIPTVIYGILFLNQKFPKTERVQSGISFADMFKATLNPLFLLMFVCMALTASLELGPGRWMDTAMKGVMGFAGTRAGILVLVYGTGLMAVLRHCAGPVVHRLSPPGILLISSILGGVGLFLLSAAQQAGIVFIAATVFYAGVCYFWPTMLGFVSERMPRTGSLGLALMGGMGMAFVGLVTTPLMGRIGDTYLHQKLVGQKAQVVQVLAQSPNEKARAVVAAATQGDALPMGDTAEALRMVIKDSDNEARKAAARAVLEPADNYGMLWGFRWTATGAIPLILVFGGLFLHFRKKGGYQARSLSS